MKKYIYMFFSAFLLIFFNVRYLSAEAIHFDRFGGWTGIKGEKRKCFSVQNINGRWWLITPEGNAFWSVGVYCVRFGGLPEKDTKKRPYKDACIIKYGNESEWARVTRLQLVKWGFNTIGDWSSQKIYNEPGLPYVFGINLSKKAENVIPTGSYGYFPNVFSEEFKESTKEKMTEAFNSQPNLLDDPWLIGYFVADEPSWYGSKGRRGSLVDDFIRLEPKNPGKQAWVDFLKSRYNSIKELNLSWKTEFKSFDELLTVVSIKDNPDTEKDKLAFLKIIAEQFSKTLTETLREFDKYHMILGSRPTRYYPEVVEGIGKYCDIFATSAYHLNTGYTISPKFDETLDTIYKYGNKPILLGVLISAQDTGLPYGMVKNQRDRGISYWRYLARVAAHPNVVGIHWFQYFDPPKNCYDEKAANWGLVDTRDEPHQDAISLIAQANKMVYAYATGLSSYAPEFDSFLGIKKETTPVTNNATEKTIDLPIANSGFEDGKAHWALQTWKGNSRVMLDKSTRHSGNKSMKITGASEEGWKSIGVAIQSRPTFTIKPGNTYKLSAWIKAKDVENSAFVRIKVKYDSGKSEYFATEGIYGTNDWQYTEITFTTTEENKAEYLCAQLVGKGTAWFDDIKLELIE